jgi:sulfate transport system ATP-binding protein
MISRIVHLGFEVRVELIDAEGDPLAVQTTRDVEAELELEAGQIVYLRPRQTASSSVGAPGLRVGDERAD